jgi:hypothetical protein
MRPWKRSNSSMQRGMVSPSLKIRVLVRGSQRLAAVVLDHAFAPDEGVAGIVPRAVEQLAEIHVEVAQEGVHAVHVRQGDAQVAPVFLRPLLEAEHLAVAQARAQRLAGLQVLVGHGAHGAQAQLHGEQHVAGAGELPALAGPRRGLQVSSTSRCHAREKRRRVP